MVAMFYPPAEDDITSSESQLNNIFDSPYGSLKMTGFDGAFNPVERLRFSKKDKRGEKPPSIDDYAFFHGDRTLRNNFVPQKTKNYSNVRYRPSEFERPTLERNMNGLKSASVSGWYDLDFTEHSVFDHVSYSTSDLSSFSADDKGIPPKYSSSLGTFDGEGAVTPHILVESRASAPQLITPVTPDHPKSTKEYQSLMAMNMNMNMNVNTNSMHIKNKTEFGNSQINKMNNYKFDRNTANFALSNARFRFISTPNLGSVSPLENPQNIDLHRGNYLYDLGEHNQHNFTSATTTGYHECHNKCEKSGSSEVDATSLSYEELRHSIIEKFTFSNSKEKDEELDENNDGVVNQYYTEEHLNNQAIYHDSDHSMTSILQQIMDDKPLLKAISKKQKRGAYKCAHCPKMFNTVFEFAKHIDEFKVERKYKCPFPLCPWKILGLPKLQELKRHCLNQHIDELTPEQQFLIHGKNGTVSNVYECESPYCDKKFHRKDSYRRHVKMVHKNPKSRFNIRLGKAIRSCPDHLRDNMRTRERYLIEKMNNRRR